MTRAPFSRSRLGNLMPASDPVSDNQRVANGLMEGPLLSAGDRELVASFVLSHASRFTPWDDRTGSPARDEAARAHNGEGAEFRYMSKFRRRYCSRRSRVRRPARGRNVFKLRRRCAGMEFWTKAMLGVVAVAVVVVLVGSVYTIGEESDSTADSIEYELYTCAQHEESNVADNELLPKGWVWVAVSVFIYNEEDLDFDGMELPTATLEVDADGSVGTYDASQWVAYDLSETTSKHYRLALYYAVPAVYSNGEEVTAKNVADYVTVNYSDGWALRSS